MRLIVKFIVLFLSWLFISASVNAQGNVKFSVFGGAGFSFYNVKYDFNVKGIDTSYNSKNRFSFEAGLSAKYDFAKFAGIRGEAQFIRKGGSIATNRIYGQDITAVTRNYVTYLDYIQISLLPQLNFHTDINSMFYFTTGGYASFNIGANESVTETTTLQIRTYDKDISNSIKKTDAGIVVGGGFESVNTSQHGVTIDLRFCIGLVNSFNDNFSGDKLKMKNYSLSINLGYVFF
jgi:hypothetical protein